MLWATRGTALVAAAAVLAPCRNVAQTTINDRNRTHTHQCNPYGNLACRCERGWGHLIQHKLEDRPCDTKHSRLLCSAMDNTEV